MQNLFDTNSYPDTELRELVAGARWGWTRSDITATYPTSLYTLKYRFSLQSGVFGTWSVDASKISDSHVVDLDQATTAAFVAGEYQWQAVVVRDTDSEEVVVDSGSMVVAPEFSAGAGDTRSWASQVLGAIRATLKGTASKDQEEYMIAGRKIINRPVGDLLDLEKEFKKRVKAERDAADRKAGRSVNNRVLVKMSA